MGKQDKRLKAEKKAKEQADVIVKAAKQKAASKAASKLSTKPSDEKWSGERVDGCSDEEFALGCRVRELRDAGEPWWAIARALELEGYGDSATTGKKGAARARQAYSKAFGSHPRTFVRGAYKGPIERNERVAKLKKEKRSDLKKKVLRGKAVIKSDTPDEEVAEMLKGRRIRWIIDNPAIIGEGNDPIEMEAAIHPRTPLYVFEDSKGERCIEFREREPRAPIAFRGLPTKTRTVRVSKIFLVK